MTAGFYGAFKELLSALTMVWLNLKVVKCDLKMETDTEYLIWLGKLFQIFGAWYENER